MISGQFTLNGTITVTTGNMTTPPMILWTSNTDVPNQGTISASDTLSGAFAGAAGMTVNIFDLTDGPDALTQQPINTLFTLYQFVNFPFDSSLPALYANFIPLGSFPGTDCSDDPSKAMSGQICTLNSTTTPPAPPGGSPFNFENIINGQNECCSSTAQWTISGTTLSGDSTWTALFTAEFNNQSFQQVLDSFVTNGSETDAYAGGFSVTINSSPTVPEPTTLTLVGAGLALLLVGSLRRKKV